MLKFVNNDKRREKRRQKDAKRKAGGAKRKV